MSFAESQTMGPCQPLRPLGGNFGSINSRTRHSFDSQAPGGYQYQLRLAIGKSLISPQYSEMGESIWRMAYKVENIVAEEELGRSCGSEHIREISIGVDNSSTVVDRT